MTGRDHWSEMTNAGVRFGDRVRLVVEGVYQGTNVFGHQINGQYVGGPGPQIITSIERIPG